VIQTLEATDIGIGQSITLTGCDSTINGTHTVFAIPSGLLIGVSDEGDLVYNNDYIIPNQILFYDAGDNIDRGAVIPNGTLTWTISCTWTTSANVARQQAGYHDAPGTSPSADVTLGTTLYAASLYRERGSVDSFASFSDMAINQPTGLTMGRIKQLLGVRRSQVA